MLNQLIAINHVNQYTIGTNNDEDEHLKINHINDRWDHVHLYNGLKQYNIDPDNRRYPCCLVWTPLPLIHWILPPIAFIGHLGIGRSDGAVLDFARPYRVSRDSKKYGRRLKILPLNPKLANGGTIESWDNGIEQAAKIFAKKPHLVLFSNCYTFVALALNIMEYNGRSDYSGLELFWLLHNHSDYLE
ncbi:transmembrane protein 222 isoform X2 [Dermatophagoides farinae]|uniref:transmembrane protein 222 isoform X2 n=1 Tax=Dermatophagoides farinae TaxID=6954 RepID=UPI001F0E9009|nr:transmembrane protein 222-like isoform X2 [Dermatophagoides farinae]